MVTVELKDKVFKEFENGASILDIAKSISEGLARNAYAGLVDGKVQDLRYKIDKDCCINIITYDDDEGKKALRHTVSHIMAQAVKRLFPDVKLAIGPAIDDGFYYDFDKEKPFTADEIKAVEDEMKKIIKEALDIERFELSRKEALELMKDEPYKIELINDLANDEVISFYKQGEFVDLCAGPHLLNSKAIKAFSLFSENGSSGAYWRGNEKNKMLSRIYGTAFDKVSNLEAYLKEKAEAVTRDHNKLGRELRFFTTSDMIGQGLPLLMPRGARVLQVLQRFVEDEEERRGYVLTKTPFMAKNDLYKVSGHWDHYKDGMFILGEEDKDEEVIALRPMTCPFQFTIYNAEQHSYKDLPIRYNETSYLFRNEASGEMHGLIRVRQFTLSEGHLVCTREQLADELKGVMDLISYFMKVLGMDADVTYRLSKWDPNNKEKYIGDADMWEESQETLANLLNELGIKYKEAEGEAAFYGPKIDIQFKNVYGKEDTAITVQVDFALGERFGMTYVDVDGKKKHPVIIHRSSVGSYERTLAFLIEKYAGSLPTWLSPVQVMVLPISDKYKDYAEKLIGELKAKGVRTGGDFRAEKIGYKIREARNDRTPYILVVGEQEAVSGTASVRSRKGDEGSMNFAEFLERVVNEIETRVLD